MKSYVMPLVYPHQMDNMSFCLSLDSSLYTSLLIANAPRICCKQQNNGWENIHHLSRHAILPLSLSLSLPD